MKLELIVARYDENLEWAERLAMPMTVYDKGGTTHPGGIRLQNVGFEAHTFLQHFATRWNDLAAVTICLQGDPFPHLKGGLGAVAALADSIPGREFSFAPLAKIGSWQTRDGAPHHPGIETDSERLWKLLLGRCPPDLWYSWYGGQFAVSAEMVQRRPQERWQRAAGLVRTKNEACVIERMWGHLFA